MSAETSAQPDIRLNNWSPEAGTPEGLYSFDRVADKVVGFDGVTDEVLERFYRDGFVAVERAFTSEEVADAIAGLMDCIIGRKKGFDLNLEASVADWDKVERPDDRLRRVRKLNAFVDSEPRLKALCEHPRLIELLTRAMGESPALYANQALLKPPHIGSEKPWHQDMAYFNLPPETMVIGIWIALDAATAENGCMHVIPGSHRDGPTVHFRVRDWQICDRDVATSRDVMVPLQPGGLMMFHGLTHHGTPPNRSPQTRRALQFHYYPASVQRITPAERLAIWGSEGKDAEC